ncbi:MAG: tRNA dihydrouridine synthase DusB [Oscillospiraceae bacterium]|nr:tRNA dihydrouridine synthase DusB [Oscillospiraceae bacterium]
MNSIYIGNVKIKQTAALAPMASVADRAYRITAKENGAAYMVSEMISAKGLCYSDRKTEELCTVTERERPCALQLFGSEPEFMGRAAAILMKYKPDIIDINMGCPVPKIAGNGSGAALMKTPALAAEIVRSVVQNSTVPVTVKIRKGWSNEDVNAVSFAALMEQAGAAAITVHGRTRDQMYRGKADWEIIRAVKEAVNVPVIGNGDVTTPQTAKAMYEQTGCDLVMVGRGSYGRPWLFGQIEEFIKNGEIPPESELSERLDIMLGQVKLAIEYKGERIAMSEARRQCAYYLKGIPNAARLRNECASLLGFDDLVRICDEIKKGE